VAERALAAGFGGRRRNGVENGAEAGADVEPAPDLPIPISGSRAERYQVVLHVEAETLRPPEDPSLWEAEEAAVDRARNVSDETCVGSRPAHPSLSAPKSELDDGTRIAATTAQRLCCDASVVRLTKAPDGSILDVGRRTRTIPPALRRALEARDRGCRYPGCGRRFTDAHHVIPWAAGGDTSLGNCVLLCKYHHRLVHEGGWSVDWWGEGKPAFYDPRGGVHCEVRWEAPELGEELVKTLLEENRQRGVKPDPWALGAHWKKEDDIPNRIYFGAMEALG
jgi:hypothetical protein